MEGSYACCREVWLCVSLIWRCTNWYGPAHSFSCWSNVDEPFQVNVCIGHSWKSGFLRWLPSAFARAPYDPSRPSVEAVLDSSRYFVIRIEDGGQKAYIGMGFAERSDSFDFSKTICGYETRTHPNRLVKQMLRYKIIQSRESCIFGQTIINTALPGGGKLAWTHHCLQRMIILHHTSHQGPRKTMHSKKTRHSLFPSQDEVVNLTLVRTR